MKTECLRRNFKLKHDDAGLLSVLFFFYPFLFLKLLKMLLLLAHPSVFIKLYIGSLHFV